MASRNSAFYLSFNKRVLIEPHLCTRQTALSPVACLSVPLEVVGIVELQNTALDNGFKNRIGNSCEHLTGDYI